MDARLLDGPDAIGSLAPAWLALAAEDPAATPFHSPHYIAAWLAEFGAGREVHLATANGGERLAAVCALSLEAGGVLRFAGDLETTDYLGPVSRPDDRDAAAAAIVEAAGGLEDWAAWEMHGLAADAGWTEPLARAAKAAGLAVEERVQDACPRITLQGSYEAYLEGLPGKLRHEIRRKERRLERETGGYAIRLSDARSLEGDLDRFYAMHRSSSGPKGKFLHEGMAGFFSRLARTLADAGEVRLVNLEVGGEVVAAVYCYQSDGVWGVYNSAFDHARRALGPGMVLMSETIRIAADAGCRTFDFLRGTEEYKYRFGAVDVPLLQLTARR